MSVAVIIPAGFGDAAGRAFFAGGDRPTVSLLYDPSRGAELGLVRGMLTQHVMESVSREMFTGAAGRKVVDEALQNLDGMTGKAASGTLIALMSLLVSFAFAMVVFGVRIQGSVIGFLAVAVACAVMASTFGLLIASIGRTPGGTRGVAILAVLMMVMLGGAWVPTFIFPAWLQRLTVVVPARWAVDGLDAMTWRGLGLESAIVPVAVLLGFAVLFGTVAAARFRWEEA